MSIEQKEKPEPKRIVCTNCGLEMVPSVARTCLKLILCVRSIKQIVGDLPIRHGRKLCPWCFKENNGICFHCELGSYTHS